LVTFDEIVAMPRKRRMIIGVAVLVAPVAAWFLAVDWSWFEEFCPHCGHQNRITQYRVLGLAVSQRERATRTYFERLAADLGAPCQHPELTRWHKHRWWGLMLCRCPCINGSSIRIDDRDYDERTAAAARRIARDDPTVGPELYDRVAHQRDRAFFEEVMERVQKAAEAQ
jgi:hypothetical protein